VPLGGLGNRLGAKIVDGVLLAAVVFALSSPFFFSFMREFVDYMDKMEQDALNGGPINPMAVYTETGFISFFLIYTAIALVVSAAYHVTLVHLKGATLGKMMAGVRVRSWDAEGLPTWGQAWKRWVSGDLIGMVISLYVWIDYLWPVWDDRKQALHDKWPGTVVVTRKGTVTPR
jgi:uncharacterized RDD family membrane protein YckC